MKLLYRLNDDSFSFVEYIRFLQEQQLINSFTWEGGRVRLEEGGISFWFDTKGDLATFLSDRLVMPNTLSVGGAFSHTRIGLNEFYRGLKKLGLTLRAHGEMWTTSQYFHDLRNNPTNQVSMDPHDESTLHFLTSAYWWISSEQRLPLQSKEDIVASLNLTEEEYHLSLPMHEWLFASMS